MTAHRRRGASRGSSTIGLRRARAGLALGPVVLISWAGAHAAFTDSAPATSSFSTATIDLKLNNADSLAFTSLSTANMLPGTTKYAALTTKNAGTADFTYGLVTASAASGTTTTANAAALAAALQVGIRDVAGTCDASTYAAASGATVMAPTALSTASFSGRALAVSASEVLCFQVTLPVTAANTLQGTAIDTTFTFTASS